MTEKLYTYYELRKMFKWEKPQEADRVEEQFTDEVIKRMEAVGISVQNDFQRRVEKWRKATKTR